MARNLSVEQFKSLMSRIPKPVAAELRAAVFDQAHRLSTAQASAVHQDLGNLRASHRVEEGKHPLQAKVKAGGEKTTRLVRHGSKVTYDYANANEFGTEKMPARPAFWPMYRLLKKPIRAAIKKQAVKSIKKVVKLT